MDRLVEREPELRTVHDALAAGAAGTGAAVVVLGPAGIGKSALLHAVPGTPLRARGGELEREFAYGVVRQLFEGPVRRLAEADRAVVLGGPARPLAPVLLGGDDPGPAGDPFALEHAVYWLTVHLAERGPLVLTVDDAQWSDLASLRALLHLTRRLADLPVALVLATRATDGGRRGFLDRIADEAVAVLEPAPLTAAGVGTLVRRAWSDADADFCAACHAASGGNPFLVSELIGAVRAAGLEPAGANAARVRAVGARSVSRSVLLRLDALTPEAAAVARALAVLGRTHQEQLLAEVAGVPVAATPTAPVGLRAALDQLRHAHLLEPLDPPRFVHGLVRDAVHDALPAAERDRLHRAAARALAGAGAAPESVAAHLLETEPGADRWVLDTLVAAASAPGAAAAAPDAAATYLDRALREAVPGVDPVPLLLALGAARFQTVDGDAASPLAEAHRLARTPELRVDTTRALASAYMTELRFDRAWSVVEDALADFADHPEQAAELEIFSAQLLYTDLPPDRFATLRDRARAWRPDPAGASPHDRSMLALQAWTAAAAVTPAVPAAAATPAADPAADPAAMARAALATGTLVHDDVWYVSVDLAVWTLVMTGDHDEALEHLDRAVDSCRRRGHLLRAATLLTIRAELRRRLGRLDDALADARAAVDVIAADQVYAPLAAAALVLSLVEADDTGAAWRVLEHYGVDAEIPHGGTADVLWFARGRLRIAGGDLAGGVDDLLAHGAVSERMGRHNPGLYPWRSTAVGPLVQLGRRAEAVALAEEELRLADLTGRPEQRGRARLALGLARAEATTNGELHAATDLLDVTVFPLDAAAARLTLGRMLRREGRRADAREQLRHAADLATRIGAVAVAQQAREELVATGARPRRTAATGVDALTPSESRVVALAARGLTNREIAHSLFVTPKTIETHLAGAYRKLGIAAKGELAAVLAVAPAAP